MKLKKKIKRFCRELNKKLVDRSPLSHVPPFNKVRDDGRNHIGAKSIDENNPQ